MILRVDDPCGGSLRTIVFYITLLFFALAQGSLVCQKFDRPKTYLAMREEVNENIKKFSNTKNVAHEADRALTQLLKLQSPLLKTWIQNRKLDANNTVEVAKAWRLYYAQVFILSKYPHKEAKLNAQIEKLVDQALARNFKTKFRKKLEMLFEQAKTASIETIESFQLSETPQLLSRIRSLRLYWPENLKSARNGSMPLDLINWGVAYDPVANEINIGLEALMYPNDNSYLSVFAHEIGHSFDSCRWGAFFEGTWPFEKVGECLRSVESVGAKKRDDSKMIEMMKSGQLSVELADSLKKNSTCNKLAYPPSGLQADQLPESFADWFSAEVMARMKPKDLKNFRADLCEERELSVGSSYPSNADRLEKIYYANEILFSNAPGFVKPKGIKYCTFTKSAEDQNHGSGS